MTKTKKEVAKKTVGYGEEAGAGFENTEGSDLTIPYISILQSLSPQVQEEADGAKAGVIYNSVTQDMVAGDKGVVFVPVHQEIKFVEWVPVDSGGGFVGAHDPRSEIVLEAIKNNNGQKYGKLTTPEGNELAETHYVYGLILNDEGTQTEGFAVIPFKSTQIKPKRSWVTAMYMLKGKPPMYANRALLKTVKQTSGKHTFYNFVIKPLKETWKDSLISPETEVPLLTEAKAFRDTVVGGMARVSYETQATPAASTGDEKIPF